MNNRKPTFAGIFAALAGSNYAPMVPTYALNGYGIAGAVQAAQLDSLFPIAQAATDEAATAAADEAIDSIVLQTLAEIHADADAQCKAALIDLAVIELASGRHTLH